MTATAWILFRLTETANQVNVFTAVLRLHVVTPFVTPAPSTTWIATRIWFFAAATPRRTTFSNATTCMEQMNYYNWDCSKGNPGRLTKGLVNKFPLIIHTLCKHQDLRYKHTQKKTVQLNHCHLTTADSSQDVKTTVTIQMAFYIAVTISPRNKAAAPLTAATIPCISTAKYSWWPPQSLTSPRWDRTDYTPASRRKFYIQLITIRICTYSIWPKVCKWHLKLHNKIKTQLAHHSWCGNERCQNSSHHVHGSAHHSSNFPKEHSTCACPSYSSHDTLQRHSQIFVMVAYLHLAETQQMISQPAGGKVPPQCKHCSAWWTDDSKYVF